jgi:hypothetical protein
VTNIEYFYRVKYINGFFNTLFCNGEISHRASAGESNREIGLDCRLRTKIGVIGLPGQAIKFAPLSAYPWNPCDLAP